MMTGLIWAGFFLAGFVFCKLLLNKKDKNKTEKIKIKPSELVQFFLMLFSNPESEYKKRIEEHSCEFNSIFGNDKPDQLVLEQIREGILVSLGKRKEGEYLANAFPRNREEQIKDPGPPEPLSTNDQKILEERAKQSEPKFFINKSRQKGHLTARTPEIVEVEDAITELVE